MRRAVRERGTVNLIHHATHLKVDIFIAGGTVLDEQQLARRREVVVGPGRTLHVHPPEDILLQKLRLYRAEASSRIASGATFSASFACRGRVSTARISTPTPHACTSRICLRAHCARGRRTPEHGVSARAGYR